ncbi:MAG: Trm112 family protein [Brucellaceae bacterium]|nr:Trm112 family protein [Brucellaceae bacterium]
MADDGTDDRDLRRRSLDVDPKMLELLVCPLTKSPLTYDRSRNELVSKAAKLAYPVRGGIPILLPSEARSIEP